MTTGRTRGGRAGGYGDANHRSRPALGGAQAAVSAGVERLLELGEARAQARSMSWRGGRLSWLEAGAGPPVLLLHGASGGGANWFAVLAGLSREHRVLAPDLPGFGLSDPAPIARPLSRAAVPALVALLDAAGADRVDLCGTSYGGLVAVRLAQLQPGRVRRLALLDSAGLGREAPAVLRLLTIPGLGRALVARPSARTVRWELRTRMVATPLPPVTEAALVAYLTASARAGSRAWFAHALRAFASLAGQREVLTDAELAALALPVLIVWGERDAFFSVTHGARAAALVPHALLRVVPGVGHSPNWERPVEFGRLLTAFFSR